MNQKQYFGIIKKLTGQANILTIPRLFIDLLGDINTALLLSQVLYWSDKTSNEEGWFYKTYAEWEEELSLKEKTVRRSINKLKALYLVSTKIKKANGVPTVYYCIHEENLFEWIKNSIKTPFCPNGRMETAKSAGTKQPKVPEPITETTSTRLLTNNPPISPQGEIQQAPPTSFKPQTPKYSEAFLQFWKAYPKKTGKQRCWGIWKRKKLDSLIDDILKSLDTYKNTDHWKVKGYIPNPSTWLNGGCWEDEPDTIDKPTLTSQTSTDKLDVLTSPPEAFLGRLLNRGNHPFGEDDLESYGRYFGYPPNEPIKTYAKLMHRKKTLPLVDGSEIPNPFYGYVHEDDVPL